MRRLFQTASTIHVINSSWTLTQVGAIAPKGTVLANCLRDRRAAMGGGAPASDSARTPFQRSQSTPLVLDEARVLGRHTARFRLPEIRPYAIHCLLQARRGFAARQPFWAWLMKPVSAGCAPSLHNPAKVPRTWIVVSTISAAAGSAGASSQLGALHLRCWCGSGPATGANRGHRSGIGPHARPDRTETIGGLLDQHAEPVGPCARPPLGQAHERRGYGGTRGRGDDAVVQRVYGIDRRRVLRSDCWKVPLTTGRSARPGLIEPNRLDAENSSASSWPDVRAGGHRQYLAVPSSDEAIRPRTPPPAPSTRIAADGHFEPEPVRRDCRRHETDPVRVVAVRSVSSSNFSALTAPARRAGRERIGPA